MLLSIVIPCFNEGAVLPLCYREVTRQLCELSVDYEILFVNDGSRDETLPLIRSFAQKDKRVGYVSFSRNFGKESAMLAGLRQARGDLVTVMDADLQDPPSLLPEMLRLITEEGYDSVATRRVSRRGEPAIRSLFARMFYRLIHTMSKVDIVDGARDYRMMTRQMAKAVTALPEIHRFSKGLFGWVGFRTKWLEYQNTRRAAGETKWSFWKLFKYAVEGLVSFTTVPLRFASFVGLFVSMFAFVYLIVLLLQTLIWGVVVPGYASLLCSVLLLGGIQLLAIGILGEYVARTYMETKRRPLYIVQEEKQPEER